MRQNQNAITAINADFDTESKLFSAVFKEVSNRQRAMAEYLSMSYVSLWNSTSNLQRIVISRKSEWNQQPFKYHVTVTDSLDLVNFKRVDHSVDLAECFVKETDDLQRFFTADELGKFNDVTEQEADTLEMFRENWVATSQTLNNLPAKYSEYYLGQLMIPMEIESIWKAKLQRLELCFWI